MSCPQLKQCCGKLRPHRLQCGRSRQRSHRSAAPEVPQLVHELWCSSAPSWRSSSVIHESATLSFIDVSSKMVHDFLFLFHINHFSITHRFTVIWRSEYRSIQSCVNVCSSGVGYSFKCYYIHRELIKLPWFDDGSIAVCHDGAYNEMLMKHTHTHTQLVQKYTCRLAVWVWVQRVALLCRCSFTASARVAAWLCVVMCGRQMTQQHLSGSFYCASKIC